MPLLAAKLRVGGQVTDMDTRKGMGGVLVRVYKDGVKQHIHTTNASGRYLFMLDNNASYVIRFSMPGRITKCFAVDTHGPEWENDGRTIDLEVEMTLFEAIPGRDFSFFDLPLGMARFTPMTGVIAWNKEYEDRVKPEVDRLMTMVAEYREQLALGGTVLPQHPVRQ